MPSQKSQLIIIGGGETHATTEEYLDSLRANEWDLMARYPDWKKWLSDGLSDRVETIRPTMPDKMNAYYPAWKIWFEKYFQYLSPEEIPLDREITPHNPSSHGGTKQRNQPKKIILV